MEYSLNELKKKYVINVADGKKLGKISDVIFTLPQNCVKGFLVENGPFSICGEKVVFSVCDIQKIGADAVLVKLENKRCDKACGRKNSGACDKKRNPRDEFSEFSGFSGDSNDQNSVVKSEFSFDDGEQDE